MPNRVVIAALALILVCFAVAESQAGYLTDDLLKSIASESDDDVIRVLIIPVSNHNPAAMKLSLNTQYSTRAERHRVGIDQLKHQTNPSQEPILALLHDFESSGKADNIKSFWVANLIEADLTVGSLEQLADHPSIDRIDIYPTIVSIPSLESSSFSLSADTVEPNLKVVKADSAWDIGYDGNGRIVCSFDTGVEGEHPALSNNYRGNKGYPASQCWFSSTDSSVFPHVFSSAGSSVSHGTHTTGIMVGHDDQTGDTIGVAPGADWIAAVAIDVPGSSIFAAFQWAADPDGDPNTVSDVPDVINHSWGVPGIGCADLFWEVIDNLEALGVVNIFAAGNEGSAPGSIRNPANRAIDSITNFSVGSIYWTDSTIYSSSSRGPSDCDNISIKPNVVAPGVFINSSTTGGKYVKRTGTSMSAPHVSGAAAILRQKNPDATVDQIKTALLNSTLDLPKGAPDGPDNTYGWGLIDIMEALRQIDAITTPSINVERLEYPEINPGDMLELELVLKNIGAAANDVRVELSNPEAGLTLFTDQINYGFIDRDAIASGNSTLDIEFDNLVESGRFYSLDIDIHYSGGVLLENRLNFFVGSRGVRTYYHHDTGSVEFTISNYGAFGFHGVAGGDALNGSFIPLGFEGYKLDRDSNDMFEGALIIGVDSAHVSDCAKNIAQEPDNDFAVIPGGSIVSSSPGNHADQETVAFFDDSYAENPIGLTVRQKTFGWADPPNDKFIIMEYIITNTSGMDVNGIRIGLYFDWDITAWNRNHGSFIPDDNLGYLCWSADGDSADFRGVKILNSEGLINHRVYFAPSETYGSRFHEGRKYQGLSDNSQGTFSTPGDVAHMTATGLFNLADGQSDTAAFAIVGGRDWNEFMEVTTWAEQKYSDLPTDIDDNTGQPLPSAFTLSRNYPNPFNPATTFSYSIPKAGRVRVNVYDLLGRTVTTLADQIMPAGTHQVIWDGHDYQGKPAASGIYFYQVKFDDTKLTGKMMLLK
jgi:subtilisin family serine protease